MNIDMKQLDEFQTNPYLLSCCEFPFIYVCLYLFIIILYLFIFVSICFIFVCFILVLYWFYIGFIFV